MMESGERAARRVKFASDLCAGCNSPSVRNHPLIAMLTAESLTEISTSEYGGCEQKEIEHYLRQRVRPIVRRKIREEKFGFAFTTFILLAILSGVISAIVRHFVEKWLDDEGFRTEVCALTK